MINLPFYVIKGETLTYKEKNYLHKSQEFAMKGFDILHFRFSVHTCIAIVLLGTCAALNRTYYCTRIFHF